MSPTNRLIVAWVFGFAFCVTGLLLVAPAREPEATTGTVETRHPSLVEMFPDDFERVTVTANPMTARPEQMRRRTIIQDGERVDVIEYVAETDDQGNTVTMMRPTAEPMDFAERLAARMRQLEARTAELEAALAAFPTPSPTPTEVVRR